MMRKQLHTGLLTGIKSALIGLALVSSGSAFAQYAQSETYQNTQRCFPGMNNAMVLRVEVVMAGSGTLASMAFNTNGTTAVGNIENAKLYWSNGGSFNTPLQAAQQVGSTVNSPSGTFSFTGLGLNLNPGTNLFFLTYDLPYSAAVGDFLDAECTGMVVDGNAQTPFTTAPAGEREIVTDFAFDYCPYPAVNPLNYNIGIARFEIADTVVTNIIATAGTMQKSPHVFNLTKDVTYNFNYNGGTGNPQGEKLYVDLNNDGFYEESEVVFQSASGTANVRIFGSYYIPCNVESGIKRARFAPEFFIFNPTPCATGYGTAYEVRFNFMDAPSPVASFTAPTTAFRGSYVFLKNTSLGLGYNFNWDYDNDGTVEATSVDGNPQYFTNGNKTIELMMTRINCGAPVSDSTTRTVTIIEPPAVPVSEFIANRNITNQTLIVRFKDLSNNGANKWHWKITPETVNGAPAYIYVNGTDSTSQNPQVLFAELGTYNVEFYAENILGAGNYVTKSAYIRNISINDMCVNPRTSEEAGFLADEGGVYANYPNYAGTGRTCGYLIQPACAANVSFNFLSFDMSRFQVTGCFIPGSNPPVLQPYDNIKIYDGTNNLGIPLHTAVGYPDGFSNGPGNTPITQMFPTVTATSGSMYIEYFVNCAFNGAGFLGEWSSTPRILPSPTSAFTGPDTVYIGAPYVFTNTSSGVFDQSVWDFNNDGLNDFTGVDAEITFTNPGVQTVKLIASRCGNGTPFTKDVVVLAPTGRPAIDFTATRNATIVLDTIRLFDISGQGPTSWRWTITPAADLVFVNGTSATSRNPFVRFNKTGQYTVKLWASNSFGADSLTRTSYIGVFTYCEPTVINQSVDIGMSKVVFQEIDRSSTAGATSYTLYKDNANVQQGGYYPIEIGRTTNFNNVNYKVWIDFNKNGSFADAGEEVFVQNPTNALTVNGTIRIPRNAQLGVTRMRIGANAEGNANLPCGPNQFGEFEDYSITISSETTKPVITLNGNSLVYMERGYTYNDLGATALDNADGDLTSQIVTRTNLNANVMGEYWFSYNVTDSAGNRADSVVRRIVVQADNSGPAITLLGGDTIYHNVGTPFNDPGATALDFVDGPIANINVSGAVNVNVIGTYYITYSATDLQGNPSSAQRVVIVNDLIAPILTMNGANPLIHDYGMPFADPGVNVTDNFYTGLTYTVSGTVNNRVIGSYLLTYGAKDPSGNVAISLTRTVEVRDISAPRVQLFGGDTVTVPVFQKFIDQGSVVTDNHTRNLFATVSGSVNTNVTGNYLLTYSAADSSGNVGAKTRLVRVVDTEAPVISLRGAGLIEINRFNPVPNPGVNISDNYNSEAELQPDVVITNNVVAHVEGLYDFCYQVADKSGNMSAKVCRLIQVNAANPNGLLNASVTGLEVYPNPTQGAFTIALGENMGAERVRIYNATGALVKEVSLNPGDRSILADLDGQAPGIYHVVVNANGNTYSTKVSFVR